jgi:L-threonylcarbamoyladenylate synthase
VKILKTLLLENNQENIQKAAEILKNGGLVGIPTETVYGLAADALNGEAVAKIFKAKGRPMDNPLIVHISDFSEIEKYNLVSEIPDNAIKLAEKFWPGPLTIIMKKSDIIPNEVSAGLDTVAIRFPSHPVAQAIIKSAETPLAAPSANLSGSPSPTTARHVMNDLDGKIDAVIDGGICNVGLESTVITLAAEIPKVLRPGGITVEQLRNVLCKVDVDSAVTHKLAEGAVVSSPGMKYKHYAPKANVVLLKCSDDEYIKYINKNSSNNVAALCCDEDIPYLNVKCYSLGKRNDYSEQAQNLFDELRRIDSDGFDGTVYSRLPSVDGVGLAVYNRLIRAAGFEVIDLEKT